MEKGQYYLARSVFINKRIQTLKKQNFQFFIKLVGEMIYRLCYQSFLLIIV